MGILQRMCIHAKLNDIVCLKFADESFTLNLDSLLIQLRPQVGPKWYQFGEAAVI